MLWQNLQHCSTFFRRLLHCSSWAIKRSLQILKWRLLTISKKVSVIMSLMHSSCSCPLTSQTKSVSTHPLQHDMVLWLLLLFLILIWHSWAEFSLENAWCFLHAHLCLAIPVSPRSNFSSGSPFKLTHLVMSLINLLHILSHNFWHHSFCL